MRRWMKTVGMVVVGAMLLSGCSVIVKVSKKGKNSNLSSSAVPAEKMSLTDGSINYLDGIDEVTKARAVLIDKLIASYNGQDWPKKFREAVRKYREFLIQKGQEEVKINDSFYTSAEDCRDIGLNFNMEDADQFLGQILQTALLAKLSETSKLHLNPEITKVVVIVQKLIELETGVKIEIPEDTKVEEVEDGIKISSAAIKISIVGDLPDDPATAADKAEVLTLQFTRTLGMEVGKADTFEAKVSVVHLLDEAAGTTETLSATITAKRENVDGRLVHTAGFKVSTNDTARYHREVAFEQINASQQIIKITDTILVPTGSSPVVTYVNVEKGQQCKTPFADDVSKPESEPTDDGEPIDDDETIITPPEDPCAKDSKADECIVVVEDKGDKDDGKDIEVILDPGKDGHQSQNVQQNSAVQQTIVIK